MRRFGALDEIFSAGPEAFYNIVGIPDAQARRLGHARQCLDQAQAFAAGLAEREIGILTCFDEAYPPLLLELHDPPPLLYYRGRLPDPARRAAAVVGCREATAGGMEVTSRVVRELVKQRVQIISSLVGGIDAAAHLAARAAGGDSFAVAESGIEHIADRERISVAVDLAPHGGVIFESAPDVVATSETRRQSHRLIVGLAQAVVVTEIADDAERVLDFFASCREVGKLAFVMLDPDRPGLIDAAPLSRAVELGAIPIDGYGTLPEIIRSLV